MPPRGGGRDRVTHCKLQRSEKPEDGLLSAGNGYLQLIWCSEVRLIKKSVIQRPPVNPVLRSRVQRQASYTSRHRVDKHCKWCYISSPSAVFQRQQHYCQGKADFCVKLYM